MTFLDSEVDPNDVTVEIIGPELNAIPCNLNLKPSGGTCTFVPLIIGMYKVRTYVCFSPLLITFTLTRLAVLNNFIFFKCINIYMHNNIIQCTCAYRLLFSTVTR